MKKVELTKNVEYDSYSAIAPVVGTVVSEPREYNGSMLCTVELQETLQVVIPNHGTATIPAGDYTMSATGGQYNPELHVKGNKTSFTINFKEGNDDFLLALLPGEPIRFGSKASAKFTKIVAFENVGG